MTPETEEALAEAEDFVRRVHEVRTRFGDDPAREHRDEQLLREWRRAAIKKRRRRLSA